MTTFLVLAMMANGDERLTSFQAANIVRAYRIARRLFRGARFVKVL